MKTSTDKNKVMLNGNGNADMYGGQLKDENGFQL